MINISHLDVRDIFGEQYAFRAGTVGTVADRTAYGFVKGYERDYNKFYRDAEVDRLAMGLRVLSETQVSTRVVLLLFQIIWMSMISHLFNTRQMM